MKTDVRWNRSFYQWRDCNPKEMAKMSEAAIMYALEDAKKDIMALYALCARYEDLLRQIAYPRRGKSEESMDIFDASKLIQSNFSLEDLE